MGVAVRKQRMLVSQRQNRAKGNPGETTHISKVDRRRRAIKKTQNNKKRAKYSVSKATGEENFKKTERSTVLTCCRHSGSTVILTRNHSV